MVYKEVVQRKKVPPLCVTAQFILSPLQHKQYFCLTSTMVDAGHGVFRLILWPKPIHMSLQGLCSKEE